MAEENGKNEITELYRRYRPTRFKDVLGQPEAVKVLEEMVRERRVPHALLFTGPSGVGKTTLAHILKSKLKCGDADFVEINAAESRGIDMVRELRSRLSSAPISGDCRIWLLDECHRLTPDGQSALLKPLESTPPHVYLMLATTDPSKLLRTVVTRCTEIKLSPLPAPILCDLVRNIAGEEKLELGDDLVERIAECAETSGRQALNLLHKVMGLESDNERMDAVVKTDVKRKAIDLCRALISPRSKWLEVAGIVKSLKDEDPEQIRRMVLGYASSVLLGDGVRLDAKAYHIICAFEDNFFDSGKSGLVRACYEVMNGR